MGYAAEVLADNPYLYWRLGESSGTTAQDASPNNRDGTYVGGPELGEAGLVDDADTAVHFNEGAVGVGTEYCESGTLTFSALTAFSIEIIVKPSSIAAGNNIIVYGPHPIFQDRNQLKITTAPNPPKFAFGFYDLGAAQAGVTSDTDAVVGNKYHIVFTISDGGFARLYLCGVLEDEYDMVGDFDMQDGTWTIADTDDSAENARFRGVVDEFAIYDYVLPQSRALAHCLAMASLTCQLNADDEGLFVDASNGNITVQLFPNDPLAPGPIRYIKRIDGTSNTVTINPGATTIDRRDSMILMPRDAIAVVTDGIEWWTL